MYDLFISYKREEQDKARRLAEALESNGWSVWWDPKLLAGERFTDVIGQTIRDVKCVIVLWSNLAITSTFVKDEASYALKLQKLVPVKLDEAEPPFGFQGLHTISLRGWDGSLLSPAFKDLEKSIEAKAGRPAAGKKTTFDLLKRPEPRSFSATEIGIDPRQLMSLHFTLMEDAAMLESLWPGRPSLDHLSLSYVKLAYGRITRRELSDFTQSTYKPDHRLEFARNVLEVMDSEGAEAIDYMPAQLKDLPAHLRKRAIEILLDNPLVESFIITTDKLITYRLRHRSPEIMHDVEQIAKHLGSSIW
jgi:TIR domain